MGNMMKAALLVLVFATLANATQVYNSFYTASGCSGTPTLALSIELGTCSCYSLDGSTCSYYQKTTLSGSTYTWTFYTDSACTTSVSTPGAALDTCQSTAAYNVKITTSNPSATATMTCTATACSASTRALLGRPPSACSSCSVAPSLPSSYEELNYYVRKPRFLHYSIPLYIFL